MGIAIVLKEALGEEGRSLQRRWSQDNSTDSFLTCTLLPAIDNCHSDPCVNGKCESTPDGYVCDCCEGWTGVNCEEGMRASRGVLSGRIRADRCETSHFVRRWTCMNALISAADVPAEHRLIPSLVTLVWLLHWTHLRVGRLNIA